MTLTQEGGQHKLDWKGRIDGVHSGVAKQASITPGADPTAL